MNELRNRGTDDILLAVVDGLKGFPEAITAVFPEATVQTCIVQLLRNSMDFVSWKDRKGFTYLKITGWGWYYLSTVLDDFSRYIVTWRLGPTMWTSDVTATLDQALAASGFDRATVMHRPRLLSDNGASYVASDLAAWLENKGMEHLRGAPYHPQTQGKIERWHQTLKSRILLDNYYLPGDLEQQVHAFVEHYNHVRYHESIDNLTPADVYLGRAEMILAERHRIKQATIANRRLQHRLQAA